MRVLCISPTPTHPQDAGNRTRIHATLLALKRAGHEVTLCLLDREAVSPANMQAMREEWAELVLVPHDRKAERPTLEGVFALDDWIQPAAEAAFRTLAARDPGFAMVLVEYVFLSRALTFFPAGTLKVLDTHDIFGGRAEKLRRLGLQPSFFFTTPEQEAHGLGRADAVLAIQEEERAELETYSPKPVLTLGHVPADPRPPLEPRPPDGRVVIGYIGSANPLNVRALKRFLSALDPASLLAAGCEVVVAGGAAKALSPAPGLRLLGPVEDPDLLYVEADLVVNPHEGGTGLKIKTVEALSRGRPVIGTAEAFAGLAPEAPFQAAPDAPSLARIARRAVRDASFRARIAEASARLWRRYAATVAAEQARLARPALLRFQLDRPRALLVTDLRFWQEELGNHARIAAIARAARAEMDLDLFFLGTMGEAERAKAGRLLGARARLFPTGPLPPSPNAHLPRGLTPFERRSVIAAALPLLAKHLESTRPDAVILEYIRLSYLRHVIPAGPLTVLDTHDVMSRRVRNFAHFDRKHFIQIGTQEELEILSGFDQILAIQQEEWHWLETLLPGRVLLAPHAVAPVPRARGGGPGDPIRIGFIGGDSPMNRDGLLWLLDQVWPAVAPLGAELHVAGEVSAAVPAGRPRVVTHGRVADPARFLQSLDIAVNPVFYGGGLKIKTVEYLCNGLPTVLTAEALTGLRGAPGEAWMLARNRGEFVAALSALILDAALRERIGEAAFIHGRRHFGPEALMPAMRVIAHAARGAARQAQTPTAA